MDHQDRFRWDGAPAGDDPSTRAPRTPPARPGALRPRRHPAKRSRVVAGVLSALTFLGLAGSMAARAATSSSTTAGSSGTTSSSTSGASSGSMSSSSDSSTGGSASSGWSAQPGSSGSFTLPNTISHAS
jgi:hypothetical protein